jgi:arabinofuranosyltransferase
LSRTLAVLFTIVFLVVLIRTAWVSDDALITLRTVLNVTHGYGLTFNVAERVQTFTHPLWMFLLTCVYVVVGNVYTSAFVLSIGVSLAAVWLAVTRAITAWQAVTVGVLLLFSRAFVDYSTSGLENPLLALLLALTLGVFLRDDGYQRRAKDASESTRTERGAGAPASERVGGLGATPPDRTRLTRLALLASLVYLTRPDAVLVVLPLIAAACYQTRRLRTIAAALAIGAIPAVAWTAYSLVYYGFPLPNTAYAKLATHISRGELWRQGVLYLVDSLDRDPLTLTAIGFAVVTGFARRVLVAPALATGIVLYLLYVVSVGGDFMAGRFLALPLFASALLLGRLAVGSTTVWVSTAAIFVVVGAASLQVPLLSNSRFDDAQVKRTGIVDERAIYFKSQSIVAATRVTFLDPDWPSDGQVPARFQVMRTCGLMGGTGLGWGPGTHLLDECALADPLLARLPAVFNDEWRTGHYRRMVPDGYEDSLTRGVNQLKDEKLRTFYEDIRLITRSPSLFAAERWRAIWRVNLGRNAHLIDTPYYRHAGAIVSLADMAAVKPDGLPADAPGNQKLDDGLAITCGDQKGRRYLDVSLDADDRYRVTFVRREQTVGSLELGPIPEYRRKPGLSSYTVDVPPRARELGFDTIVIAPRGGTEPYAVGHLLVDGFAATDAELQRRVAIRDGR